MNVKKINECLLELKKVLSEAGPDPKEMKKEQDAKDKIDKLIKQHTHITQDDLIPGYSFVDQLPYISALKGVMLAAKQRFRDQYKNGRPPYHSLNGFVFYFKERAKKKFGFKYDKDKLEKLGFYL